MIEIRHKETNQVLCRVAAENLRGAVLAGAELAGAALHDMDLTGADLRGANLRAANLACADLTRADLKGADLREAVLGGTILFGANLDGADLRGKELVETGLDCAFMRGARYDKATKWPRLFIPRWYGCVKRKHPSEVAPSGALEARGDEVSPAGE